MLNLFNGEGGGSDSPLVVFIGLIVGQLFLYGRKVKANARIMFRDVIADVMQFGFVFAGCMGFLSLLRATGLDLDDTWQVITVTIILQMSFDTWIDRLRSGLSSRLAMIAEAFFGKMPNDAIVRVPAGSGTPRTLDVTLINPDMPEEEVVPSVLKDHLAHTPKVEDDPPPPMGKAVDRLNQVNYNEDDENTRE